MRKDGVLKADGKPGKDHVLRELVRTGGKGNGTEPYCFTQSGCERGHDPRPVFWLGGRGPCIAHDSEKKCVDFEGRVETGECDVCIGCRFSVSTYWCSVEFCICEGGINGGEDSVMICRV